MGEILTTQGTWLCMVMPGISASVHSRHLMVTVP